MPLLRRIWKVLVAAWLCAAPVHAHTLPISDLILVADKEYLHLELSLNPTELTFLSEPPSVTNETFITKKVLEQLKVKVGSTTLTAETSGIAGQGESHHLVLRAHYPLKNISGTLQIESSLCDLTGTSHFTQVTFRNGDGSQLARLDNQTRTANFGLMGKSVNSSPAEMVARPEPASLFVPLLLLGLLPMGLALIGFRHFARNHSVKELNSLPADSAKI